MSNPTILPSGILGTTKALLKRVAENGAGAVTIKSVSVEAREGHKNPTVIPLFIPKFEIRNPNQRGEKGDC